MRIIRYFSKCLLLALIVASTNAYSDTLLMRIPGINGEYQGAGFEGWTEIYSFSGEIAEGGCGSFTVSKALDTTSAAILMSTALATPFAHIAVVNRAIASGDGSTYTSSSFSLNNAVITSVSQSGSSGSGGALNESVTVTPESMTLTVYGENGAQVGATTVACAKVKTK